MLEEKLNCLSIKIVENDTKLLYKEELHKKDLNNPDNRDDVITHLEPDILKY